MLPAYPHHDKGANTCYPSTSFWLEKNWRAAGLPPQRYTSGLLTSININDFSLTLNKDEIDTMSINIIPINIDQMGTCDQHHTHGC